MGKATPKRERSVLAPEPVDFKRVTRSKTAPDRKKALKAEADQAKKEIAAEERRRAANLAARPAALPGDREDGSFHIAFLQMGQGDCCIMTTPKGTVVVVDCGTDSKEEEKAAYIRRVKAVLNGPKFLRNSVDLDVLILTHPDSDHYNQLKTMLADRTTIGAMYYSGLRTDYSKEGASAWLVTRMSTDTATYRVINNDRADGTRVITLNGVRVPDAAPGVTVNRMDGDDGIRIIDEPNCKISILAGGVERDTQGDDGGGVNRASLVTLVEVFGKKVLLCGDSTRSTEEFLMLRQAGRIGQVDIAHIGHHGSNRTSSLEAYVQMVRPKIAFASAGRKIDKHHLPSSKVIGRYITYLDRGTAVPKHDIYYWKPITDKHGTSYQHTSVETVRPVFTTGSWGTLQYTITSAGAVV
jgi:beta-lactamase superfamily II metal-dependent hydrolase